MASYTKSLFVRLCHRVRPPPPIWNEGGGGGEGMGVCVCGGGGGGVCSPLMLFPSEIFSVQMAKR